MSSVKLSLLEFRHLDIMDILEEDHEALTEGRTNAGRPGHSGLPCLDRDLEEPSSRAEILHEGFRENQDNAERPEHPPLIDSEEIHELKQQASITELDKQALTAHPRNLRGCARGDKLYALYIPHARLKELLRNSRSGDGLQGVVLLNPIISINSILFLILSQLYSKPRSTMDAIIDALCDVQDFLLEVLRRNPTNTEEGDAWVVGSKTLGDLLQAKKITQAQYDILKAHRRKQTNSSQK
ncbi:hypothetical protein J7T55_004257 [Diaporthe amygdali]|uniref:uncharacterized protein n=1 Tax=Phomopsis amygdali TaxID=1214568 RepID=UPI0022FDF258|nr:uncharacterized protein J7T55_004257 [Diaporthe amygdali]KAJ0100746.1 hypothetical protein J7T55_004257 [Diaporthe amygdali]